MYNLKTPSILLMTLAFCVSAFSCAAEPGKQTEEFSEDTSGSILEAPFETIDGILNGQVKIWNLDITVDGEKWPRVPIGTAGSESSIESEYVEKYMGKQDLLLIRFRSRPTGDDGEDNIYFSLSFDDSSDAHFDLQGAHEGIVMNFYQGQEGESWFGPSYKPGPWKDDLSLLTPDVVNSSGYVRIDSFDRAKARVKISFDAVLYNPYLSTSKQIKGEIDVDFIDVVKL